MVVALPWYAIYPLAPPRFMGDYGWDFVDTLAVYGPNYFSEQRARLRKPVRGDAEHALRLDDDRRHHGRRCHALAVARPDLGVFLTLLLGVTVIVTGNHYWLDVVGGWIVIGLSLLINRLLPFPLPIQLALAGVRQARDNRPNRLLQRLTVHTLELSISSH